MSGSLNKVMLIGNLGKDPEAKHFEGGGMLVKFPIATTESYKNREGQKVESTEWHNIVVGRRGLAEVCEKYLNKGDKVYIEGRIKTRSWQDQEGQTRYATEIQADNMTMLTPKGESNSGSSYQAAPAAQQPASNPQPTTPVDSGGGDFNPGSDDDDLPF
ncbi:MAG: single-stranded DNA-binding protein [Flavobacteriia bacterium]|nr:single-stranded DNA-binding protein [Flavobacteriia bacterium]